MTVTTKGENIMHTTQETCPHCYNPAAAVMPAEHSGWITRLVRRALGRAA